MRKIIGMVMMLVVIGACTQIDCPVENRVYTLYDLLKEDGTTDTLNVDTLYISTKKEDGTLDTLVRQAVGITYYELAISYDRPQDEFYYALHDTLGNVYKDTVRVSKEDTPHFESVDCQPTFFHKITDVTTTHHIIEDIEINNPTVNYNATEEHFHIYFKARY